MRNLFHRFALAVILPSCGAIYSLPDIRDCLTEHYDISGDSGSELLAEMKAKNATKGGYFAHTRYNYKSKCSALTLTCTVRLPRWVEFDAAPNTALKQKWEKFYVALVAHEQGHVDIFNEDMKAAGEAAGDLSCSAATKSISGDYKAMSTRQKEFDAETQHGTKQGASFGGSKYLGIAYSAKADTLGFAYDAETKEAAAKLALKNCTEKDCKFVVWANGEKSCVTIARGVKGGYGYAQAEGQESSETKAITACNKYAKACTVRKTICAGTGELE